jgi:hypothetical protein
MTEALCDASSIRNSNCKLAPVSALSMTDLVLILILSAHATDFFPCCTNFHCFLNEKKYHQKSTLKKKVDRNLRSTFLRAFQPPIFTFPGWVYGPNFFLRSGVDVN